MLQSPAGKAACLACWKEFARQSASGSRYFTCHAGIQYISAPIIDQEKTIGYFLAGQFYWQSPDPQEAAQRVQRMSGTYDIPVETLQQAAGTVPMIAPEQHSRVEAWPKTAARAVQSILHERLSFMDRLQQIASLTQM
jgi:ligand-binding sensor protein